MDVPCHPRVLRTAGLEQSQGTLAWLGPPGAPGHQHRAGIQACWFCYSQGPEGTTVPGGPSRSQALGEPGLAFFLSVPPWGFSSNEKELPRVSPWHTSSWALWGWRASWSWLVGSELILRGESQPKLCQSPCGAGDYITETRNIRFPHCTVRGPEGAF